MRSAARIVVPALLLASVREASAQPAPEPPKLIRFAAELQVALGPGTERCPDAAPYLRKAVAEEMGYDPFAPGTKWRAAGTFDVKVARVPGGLEAVTTFVDAASVAEWTRPYHDRTTTRAACESVYKGVALQIVAELTRFDARPEPESPSQAPACPASSPCPACPPVSPFSVWPPEWPMAPLRAPEPDPPRPPERAPLSFRFGSGVWVDSDLRRPGLAWADARRERAVPVGLRGDRGAGGSGDRDDGVRRHERGR